jgi:thiol-disulfide isomerase/thioredoxin
MSRQGQVAVWVLSTLLGLTVARPAAADQPVKIGSKIPNLTFKDIRYLSRSLDDFPKKKAFVLVFSNTSCPLVQRYWPTLNKLEKDHRGKGVQFVAINVGADDSIVEMAAQAVKYEVAFPFVKDFKFAWAPALGVQRTPEVVVLDEQRQLRYRGRIDDQYRLGGTRSAPTRHDLKEALDAVLSGAKVAVAETPVDGCLITRPEPPALTTKVTFAEHIAPLLKKHCQECHRPGTAAPFALLTYQQASARAKMIGEVVDEQRMPPWYASAEHGTFTNRRGLSAAERELVLHWARSGKALGNPSKLPKEPALENKSKWAIGEPDLILKASEHQLPAEGVVAYKYVVLPYIFLRDTWVQGVQILPDNPRVVHHCNMAYLKLGEGFKIANFITGTVPGGEAMTLEKGLAYRIPAGSTLILQIHYVTTGRAEKCRIAVGFKYAGGVVQKRLRFTLLADHKFAIPPGEPAHKVTASQVLSHDAVGVGLFSHMHVRGRDMTFRAHYPDGKSETLLVIPNFSFDWQMPYRWEPGKKRFPKGTRLECIAHYDNSEFNPFNPNPKATVRDGQQTYNEMLNGFVFFTDANEKLNLDIDPKTGGVKAKAVSPPKGT